MAWVKLTDNFPDDPRLEAAGPEAFVIHVAAMCYCMRLLTDGFVPARVARRLWSVEDIDAAIAALVDNGLWKPAEAGYELVGFLDDQRDSETIRREREAAAERQRKWYENKRANKGRAPNGVRNAVSNGITNAYPDQPSPAPTKGLELGGLAGSAHAAPSQPPAEIQPTTMPVTFSFEEPDSDG